MKKISEIKKVQSTISTLIPDDYQCILESINEVIFVIDLNGFIICLNQHGRKFFRSRIEKIVGKNLFEVIAPEYISVCKSHLRQIRKGKAVKPFKLEIIDKKGERIPLFVTQSIIKRGKKTVGSVNVAINISDQRMKETELHWRMKEISALNAVARVLSQPYDLDLLLNNVLTTILEVTDTEAGGICLLNKKNQELVLRVHQGFSPEIVQASTAIKVGEGISGVVVATNKPFIIKDLAAEKKLTRPLLLKEGFRTGVVVPITLKGEAIGVFNILSRRPRRYQPKEVRLLTDIGGQIGVAVENAFLIRYRDEEILRLTALNRISHIISSEINLETLLERIYKEVKTIMHPENFCITLYNEETNQFDVILKYEKDVKQRKYSFPADRGLSSRVFFNKKSILTKDYLTECKKEHVAPYGPPTKAWIGVPIIERGKAIGSIYMYDYEKEDVFDDNDLELLTTIAGQTAVVIENVRQYRALRERVEELELLFEIGQSIVSVLDLNSVLDQIVNMLRRKFGHEKVAICLIDEPTNELYIKVLLPPTERFEKVRLKIGEGITGYVAQTKKTYYAPDVKKDIHYIEYAPTSRSEIAVPLKVGDRVIGVLNVEADLVDAFSREDIRMLESVSHQAAIAIENARLYESLEESYFDTIRALVSAMEAKDAYTRGHSERVRELSLKIAESMGLTTEEIKMINYAGFLHDIGKIGISDTLLSKVEPLTEEEYEKIRLHPVIGNNMIKHVEFLTDVSSIIRHEHEKYDGTGYPDRLKGEDIPLGARIIAVADAYDAMTTDRPYRKALTHDEAINRLKKASGTQFDPKIVATILHILKALPEDNII